MNRLLVIDPDPTVVDQFAEAFRTRGWEIHAAATAENAFAELDQIAPAVIALDLHLTDMPGLEALRRCRQLARDIPVLAMTWGAISRLTVQAIQLGAMDVLTKPLDNEELLQLGDRASEIRRLNLEQAAAPVLPTNSGGQPHEADWMIGRCGAMQQVYKSIGRVAGQNVNVLIRGESGTGKELVARALYQYSHRSQGPFLAVNCAAIPDALLESQLFGHEKGAFTGADRQRRGKFELCHRGTLFLDEIGDMNTTLQSKILRVLQEKTFERVGGDAVLTADVRVIAATHRPLEQMCAAGRFREDLFYRINGYSIELPPLRARGADIDLLVDHFLRETNREFGTALRTVSGIAREMLASYPWPGNIRELQSVIRHAALEATGAVLIAEFLPASVRSGHPGANNSWAQAAALTHFAAELDPVQGAVLSQLSDLPPLPHGALPHETLPDETLPTSSAPSATWTFEETMEKLLGQRVPDLYDRVIQEVERRLLTNVLAEVRGNQTEAARLLGITRTTLRGKLGKLNLGIRRVVNDGPRDSSHESPDPPDEIANL